MNIHYKKDDYKKLRKFNAIKLPEDLSMSIIPKYVVYYNECYNKEKMLFREYFKIEKHPKLQNINKVFTSSKSNKISILDKLDEIKIILNKIEDLTCKKINNVIEENNVKLPKYISLKHHETDESKYYLIYDKKLHNKTRQSYKIIYNTKTDISLNLLDFISKIKIKFE